MVFKIIINITRRMILLPGPPNTFHRSHLVPFLQGLFKVYIYIYWHISRVSSPVGIHTKHIRIHTQKIQQFKNKRSQDQTFSTKKERLRNPNVDSFPNIFHKRSNPKIKVPVLAVCSVKGQPPHPPSPGLTESLSQKLALFLSPNDKYK